VLVIIHAFGDAYRVFHGWSAIHQGLILEVSLSKNVNTALFLFPTFAELWTC
jgi:hypothetical protein